MAFKSYAAISQKHMRRFFISAVNLYSTCAILYSYIVAHTLQYPIKRKGVRKFGGIGGH